MDERENFEAQQEALKETAGPTSKSTRDRIQSGLTQYLMAQARHDSKVAKEERERERDKEERERGRQDRE